MSNNTKTLSSPKTPKKNGGSSNSTTTPKKQSASLEEEAKKFLRGDADLLNQPRVRTRGQAKISDTLTQMIEKPKNPATKKRKRNVASDNTPSDVPATREMSKEEEDKIRKEILMVFRLFDFNRDGKIEKDELVKIIHSMGKLATKKRLEKIFSEADKDRNGTIERDEFVAYMLAKRKAKRAAAFDAASSNGAKRGRPAKKDSAKKEDEKKEDEKKEDEKEDQGKEEEKRKSSSFSRGLSITNYYTEYAGLNDEIQAEKLDQYNNPEGREFDLGREGAFTNFTILVGLFQANELSESDLEKYTGEALRTKGFNLVVTEKHDEFIAKLGSDSIDQAWIISSRVTRNDPAFEEAVEKFHKSGRGIAFWGDNDPYFQEINPSLKKLFNVELTGNTPGNKVLELGDPKAKGKFAPHLLTSGITKLFEGITISYPKSLASCPLDVLATSTDGNPCMLYGDYAHFGGKLTASNVGRVIVDMGWTKLGHNWDSAGTSRYVRNIAVWLLALDHRFTNEYPLQGPIKA